MTDIIVVSVVLSYAVLVWLKTNAFVEYMNLLGFQRLFHISEYNELHKNGYDGNYVDFLYEYFKDYFVVRLVACPICLSFWLGILVFLLDSSLFSLCAGPLILFFYLLFNRML